jgi:hypothetical protein
MTIGIPYARHEFDADGEYVVCPVCSQHVRLEERKDFESFTGREYADHYAERHDADAGKQTLLNGEVVTWESM